MLSLERKISEERNFFLKKLEIFLGLTKQEEWNRINLIQSTEGWIRDFEISNNNDVPPRKIGDPFGHKLCPEWGCYICENTFDGKCPFKFLPRNKIKRFAKFLLRKLNGS